MSTPAETTPNDTAAPATDTETPETTAPGAEATTPETETTAPEEPVAEDASEQTTAEQASPADDSTAAAGAAPRRIGSRKVAELEREGEIAADFLETLLDIADLDGDLEVDVEGDRAAVAIVDSEDGAAPQRLVGREAQVLEALQELTRLAVQAETGERSRLMLDVAGHRAGRRAALVAQAKEVAARVKENGEREELEPMTAFERKVVHDEVLAAGLTSESEGEEPHRYVVVLPSR